MAMVGGCPWGGPSSGFSLASRLHFSQYKKVYSSSWCRVPAHSGEAMLPPAERCLAACSRLKNCRGSISNCNNRYRCSPELTSARPGPHRGRPSTEISKAEQPVLKHLGLGFLGEGPRRQHRAGGLEESPAGRGPPRARPGRRGAGGARGWAGPRVRSGSAAGTRRCAPRLNEPGLPARATSREPAAGAGAASFPRRGGRRRPSGSRLGGLRRCARCREAAASGDGDRAEAARRAVTAAPPPQALSERRR